MALKWLARYDNELAETIQSATLEKLFNLNGRPGMTIILPTGEARKEILRLLDEDADTADMITGGRMLAAYVLLDAYSTPESFKSADMICNALKQVLAVDHAKSTRGTVALACGVRITQHRDGQIAPNISVWVAEGSIPINLPVANVAVVSSRRKIAVDTKPQPKGMWSAESTAVTPATRSQREQIAHETETHYSSEVVNSNITGQRARPVFMLRVLGLCDMILQRCSDQAIADIFYGRIMPLLSWEPVDFYLLFEPHLTSGQYMIPTDLIKQSIVYQFSPVDAMERVEAAMRSAPSGIMVNIDRLGLAMAFDEQRDAVSDAPEKRMIAETVCTAYGVIASNSIGGKTIFPAYVASLYKNDPMKKVSVDELRYLSAKLFGRLESAKFDRAEFNRLTSTIRRYFETPNYTCIVNGDAIASSIQPTERIREVLGFVNSKYFLFTPLTIAETKEFAAQVKCSMRQSPTGESVWFPYDQRGDLAVTSAADESGIYISENDRVVNMLKQLKTSKKISAETKNTIVALLAESDQTQ